MYSLSWKILRYFKTGSANDFDQKNELNKFIYIL